jgi:hypothetical protein
MMALAKPVYKHTPQIIGRVQSVMDAPKDMGARFIEGAEKMGYATSVLEKRSDNGMPSSLEIYEIQDGAKVKPTLLKGSYDEDGRFHIQIETDDNRGDLDPALKKIYKLVDSVTGRKG